MCFPQNTVARSLESPLDESSVLFSTQHLDVWLCSPALRLPGIRKPAAASGGGAQSERNAHVTSRSDIVYLVLSVLQLKTKVPLIGIR